MDVRQWRRRSGRGTNDDTATEPKRRVIVLTLLVLPRLELSDRRADRLADSELDGLETDYCAVAGPLEKSRQIVAFQGRAGLRGWR